MRIVNRKWGRNGESVHATGATHVIKIGYDARGQGEARPKPGKLPGFLICRDSLDPSGQNLVIDHDAMARLGSTPENIKAAKAGGLKAPAGLLPVTLRFAIMRDARATDRGWDYGDTFKEEYECWRSEGRWCAGDGAFALRKQPDGTRAQIKCVPAGRTDHPAAEWCPQSVAKECRGHARLVVCLWIIGPGGAPEPLDPRLGWEARYRFDTSSGYNPVRILTALDAAADRVGGRIAGLYGLMVFNVQRKRTGDTKAPVGLVGQVTIAIDEQSIRRREQEIRAAYLEDRRIDARLIDLTPAAPRQIEGPAADRTEGAPAQYEREAAAPAELEPEDDGLDPDGAPEPDMLDQATAPQAFDPDEAGEGPPQAPAPGLGLLMAVAEADPATLALALERLVAKRASGGAAKPEEIWESLATFTAKDGRVVHITNSDWYFAGETDAARKGREKRLRLLAGELAGDPDFELAAPAAAGEAAK